MYSGGIGASSGSISTLYESSRVQIRRQEADSEEFAATMAEQALEMFDEDGDGVLSADEFEADIVARADSDGDGLLTREELEEDAQNNMQPPPPAQGGGMDQLLGQIQMLMQSENSESSTESLVSQIFDSLDVNQDGVVSTDELEDERLASADTDGDGTITMEELEADILNKMQGGPPPAASEAMAAQIFDSLDVNKDGVVSADELEDDRLAAADTDGDGSITLEELTADLEANMASGPPPPPDNMGQGMGFQMPGGSGMTNDAETIGQLYDMLGSMAAGYFADRDTAGGLNIFA